MLGLVVGARNDAADGGRAVVTYVVLLDEVVLILPFF